MSTGNNQRSSCETFCLLFFTFYVMNVSRSNAHVTRDHVRLLIHALLDTSDSVGSLGVGEVLVEVEED